MDMMIRGLVYGNDEEEGLSKAKEDVFEPLVVDGPFDRYLTVDEDFEEFARRYADAGDLPAVTRSTTDMGEALIGAGWEATVTEYRQSFARLREFLDEHDQHEFWYDADVNSEYSFDFRSIGEEQGSSTYLYDQDGQGLRTRDHLNQVLNHWDSNYGSLDQNPLMEKNLYIIPAEVRY